MLKKLRTKLIALIMVVAAGVLLVAFATVCFVTYQQSLQEVNAQLEMALSRAVQMGEATDPLASSNGSSSALASQEPEGSGEALGSSGLADTTTPPEPDSPASTTAPSDAAASVDTVVPPSDSASAPAGNPPEIGGERGGGDPTVPIALYALLEDGTSLALSNTATASLSEEVLAEATATLADAAEESGSLYSLGLHYQKRIVDGTTYLAFADMSATSSWKSLIPLFALVGAAALAVFLVIGVVFSNWALRPVRQAWDRQRQFVADASHDLKTPLTVILANTSILQSHPDRTIESERQWLESTQQEAQQMQHLVEDLLTLAQVDEKAHPPFQRVDLSEAVEAEVLQFESIAFDRGLSLEGGVQPDVYVMGDTQLLRRAVSTLLENACKYAEMGGTVTATLTANGREAKLSVHNDGPAIPPDDLPHIFERFYRADKARSGSSSPASGDQPRTQSSLPTVADQIGNQGSPAAMGERIGGFGLGLAIAHGIVEDHHGTLTATSTEAEGTIFTATIPLAN